MSAVGTLTYHPPGTRGRRGAWGVEALPHVMIRVKRIFPRVQTSTTGRVYVADTPDVAMDLDWLHQRHPLAMAPDVAAHLNTRVAEHVKRAQAVDAIMAGGGGGLALELEPSRQLRPYQEQFVAMARVTRRMILGDDLGLGKTTEALGLLGDPAALPALVVCPPHLQRQWLRELAVMWPLLRGHIVTKGSPYDLRAVRGANGYPPDVLIISYSKLAGWVDALVDRCPTVIFDEAHDLRAGTDTQKGAAAARLADAASLVVGLTATPVTNYGDEVHQLYSIIAPDVLGERAEFLREWGGGTVGSHTKVRNPKALGAYLREQGVFLRRTRADVGRELPAAPLRIRHEIDSDPKVIEQASADVAAMARLILDTTADRDKRFVTAGQFDMRMRQATGLAKAPYVAEFVRMLLASEQRILLVGWHRACYDVWLRKLADYRPVLYTGSESATQKQRAVDAFLDGDARVLIMSLRSGVGLDGLQRRCRTVVFGELDWSPAIHDQIIGRLGRDGQEHEVNGYFLVSDSGADPVMDETLQLKRGQAAPIVDPDAPLFEPTTDAALRRVELLARSFLTARAEVAA